MTVAVADARVPPVPGLASMLQQVTAYTRGTLADLLVAAGFASVTTLTWFDEHGKAHTLGNNTMQELVTLVDGPVAHLVNRHALAMRQQHQPQLLTVVARKLAAPQAPAAQQATRPRRQEGEHKLRTADTIIPLPAEVVAINLDRRVDRWSVMAPRLQAAGSVL